MVSIEGETSLHFRVQVLIVGQNIHVTAWGPLTIDRNKNVNVTTDPKLIEIAQSVKITPTQLALSWAVQRSTSVIPKSSNLERLPSNLESMYISISNVKTFI